MQCNFNEGDKLDAHRQSECSKPINVIPKKFTKKFGNKVINRQYFRRKTGLKRAKPAKNGTEERILTLRCQQKST